MIHKRNIFKIAPANIHLQNIFHQQLGISKILAQVLVNRGINHAKEAAEFLDAKLEHLLDPYSFTDMHKAVALIKKAAKNKERVMLFSDYDADGITALVLLKNILNKLGLDTVHYLPHRIKEGYGLNKNAVKFAKEKKAKLLITADCGTNNHEQAKELQRQNIEVIVTDHHEATDTNAKFNTSAMINPKVKGSGYKYRDLAGVGVAYKLCQALTNSMLLDELDLVSLGTIADVVPLTGENRILVKEGLSRLTETKRPGIRALMETSGIKDKKITPGFVSYILGPRINASGRMDSAEVALNLLMSEDKDKALELAGVVNQYNRERQKIEGQILEEAQDLIDKEINFKEHRVLVLAKEGWHEGVLGIVASKLADRFYRPVIIISKTSDLCKGSGRSIENFHLLEALLECSDFLKAFGGHSHAAGFMIAKDNIDEFRNKINRLAKEQLLLYDLLPSLNIDLELSLADLNEEVVREFEGLEPFGKGNPEPLFYTRNLNLKGSPQTLGRETLKFWVTDGNATFQAIAFGMASFKDTLLNIENFDLVYSPRIDDWQGEEGILLEVRDISFREN